MERRCVMANEKQKNYWTNVAGKKWLAMGGAMEARFAEVNDVLITRAALQAGEAVLDIGCGTGVTSLAAARLVGPQGRVRGVDVAEPLLEVANAHRAESGLETLDFILADAQTDNLGLPADTLLSRFGVMFFEDPIAAFKNLRENAKPGARMVFAAWAPVGKNLHWLKPLEIARTLVGEGIVRRPHAPGPLAFDDIDYVASILAQSGWNHAEIEEKQISLHGESLAQEARIACLLGPAGALFEEKRADPDTLNRAADMFLNALPDYTQCLPDGRVNLPATIHLITATA